MLRVILAVGTLQVIAIVVGMLRAKILALLLGPAGIGVTSVIDQLVQLIAYLSAFSLPYASVKFLSRAHSRDAASFRASFAGLGQLLGILSTIGAFVALAVVLLAPQVLSPEVRNYRFIIIPALAGIPCASLNGYFGGAIAAAQRARSSAVVSLLGGAAVALAVVIGVAVGGLGGLYWGNFVAVVVVAVVLSAYLRRTLQVGLFRQRGEGAMDQFSDVGDPRVPNVRKPIHLTLSDLKETLRENPDVIAFSLVLYVTTVATTVSYLVTRLAVLQSQGEVEAGLLQAALALAGALGLALGPANGLYLTPILNRDIPRAVKLGAATEFQSKLTLLIGAAATPIVLFPQLLLFVLYSAAFVSVSPLVYLFVVGQAILLLGGVYQAVLIGFDDLKAYGVVTTAGYALLGGSAFVLAPRFGIPGVSVGFIAAGVLVFSLSLLRLTRAHHLAPPLGLMLTMMFGLGALALLGYVGSQSNALTPQVILLKLALGGSYLAQPRSPIDTR